jgi:hypothetical protein
MCNPWTARLLSVARECFQAHTTYAHPIRMEENNFSDLVSFTSIFKFIAHYLSSNVLRAYCLKTFYVGNFQMFDSVRSEKNTEWQAPTSHLTLYKRVIIMIIIISRNAFQ